MSATPRAGFVPGDYVAVAYRDEPIPIGHGQVTTQPSLSARMIEGLRLAAVSRVFTARGDLHRRLACRARGCRRAAAPRAPRRRGGGVGGTGGPQPVRRIICGCSLPDPGSRTSHASAVSSGWVSGHAASPQPVAVSRTRCRACPARSQSALPPNCVDGHGELRGFPEPGEAARPARPAGREIADRRRAVRGHLDDHVL